MTQEQQMPSSTRFTVHVEGHGQTYWDNIHEAITYAQRAVYAGPDNTTRALDDLKAGRIAEWSYGFSAVRIYPPQNSLSPQPEQEPQRWAVFCAGCRKEWSVPYQHPGKSVCAECESKLKAQPEQEPFCYHDGSDIVGKEFADHSDVFPLYTAPPQRKPLTDDEIEDEWERITGHSIFGGDRSLGRAMYISPDEVTEFARAIEAAHGIKE